MLHALYTADPKVFLAVIIVYHATLGAIFIWSVIWGTREEWGPSLSPVFYFGFFFYAWGLLFFRILAETVCENIQPMCLPWEFAPTIEDF